MDDIKHLSMPLRLVGDAYATCQQDTNTEAADCVRNILVFPRGLRPEDINFGIDDPTFETQPIDVDDIATTISVYEPRVNADIQTVDEPDGTTSVKISINLPTSDDETEVA